MANCINANEVANPGSNVQIEAIQTVMPMKPTDPRLSRRVAIGENLGSGNLQSRFHIVLCYNKASEEDSGWLLAGWIKESLGKALVEKPLLAGRLKRKGENDDNGEFEIVSNDSGVRLVEANMPMDLADFLDLIKERKNGEAELVFWEDVNESNPQFSPLFYVQVTNFKCGRYSIGISCSLFQTDPYGMTSFLNRWSKIHNNIVTEADMPKIPTFFLPNLRKTGCSPTLSTSSTTNKQINESLIFKIPSNILNLRDDIHKNFAEKCVEEVEDKLGKKLSSKFCLFVRETSEDIKVETFSREGISPFDSIAGLVSVSLDDLEGESIRFNEGNKAVHFSCWISNSGNEDLVLITPTFVFITPFL
ncbi:PREDICTED: protein ECERIFERUM 1-like [Nicotiana attenuata]|uniref:Shikimate o-hydroxycinnamoyltransferase n=1 Tax=Nicotiana attenuata TaxID=49451 RepID=A0A1J6KIM1_NICAT|nr:PREDICTED: protein ECERIFERUM 1-like [Nicotiana attenuata]OIT22643.1 shikimate o-hydroxycinnamoyltransferase [Nicotiana attenuata]